MHPLTHCYGNCCVIEFSYCNALSCVVLMSRGLLLLLCPILWDFISSAFECWTLNVSAQTDYTERPAHSGTKIKYANIWLQIMMLEGSFNRSPYILLISILNSFWLNVSHTSSSWIIAGVFTQAETYALYSQIHQHTCKRSLMNQYFLSFFFVLSPCLAHSQFLHLYKQHTYSVHRHLCSVCSIRI